MKLKFFVKILGFYYANIAFRLSKFRTVRSMAKLINTKDLGVRLIFRDVFTYIFRISALIKIIIYIMAKFQFQLSAFNLTEKIE